MKLYENKSKKYLDNYKLLKGSIARRKKRIADIENKLAPKNKMTIDYTKEVRSKQVNNFQGVTTTLIKEKRNLENDLKLLNEIEESIASFAEVADAREYSDVLIYTHIDKKSIETIIDIMDYSSRTSYYKIYNKAIKQMATYLFGSKNL